MIATIILICLASGRFLIDAVNHGQEKKPSKYNSLVGLCVMLIQFALFYYAGLFDKF